MLTFQQPFVFLNFPNATVTQTDLTIIMSAQLLLVVALYPHGLYVPSLKIAHDTSTAYASINEISDLLKKLWATLQIRMSFSKVSSDHVLFRVDIWENTTGSYCLDLCPSTITHATSVCTASEHCGLIVKMSIASHCRRLNPSSGFGQVALSVDGNRYRT